MIYMTVGTADQFRNAGSLEIERGIKPGDLEKVLELILFLTPMCGHVRLVNSC